MSSPKVATINSSSSTSIEDIANWHRQKADRGEIPESSARVRITGLNQISSVLASDEPRTAAYVLQNVESITKRWATKNGGSVKSGTIKAYESGARSAIEDYFRWQEDPGSFEFARRDSIPKNDGDSDSEEGAEKKQPRKSKPKSKPKRPLFTPQAAVNDSVQQFQQVPTASPLRNFPVGQGKDFDFRLPQDGITVDEWRRIACHLLTLASDFNPATPAHAQTWAIVAQSKKD